MLKIRQRKVINRAIYGKIIILKTNLKMKTHQTRRKRQEEREVTSEMSKERIRMRFKHGKLSLKL